MILTPEYAEAVAYVSAIDKLKKDHGEEIVQGLRDASAGYFTVQNIVTLAGMEKRARAEFIPRLLADIKAQEDDEGNYDYLAYSPLDELAQIEEMYLAGQAERDAKAARAAKRQAENQKVRRVSLFRALNAKPYRPDGGWDDPDIVANCHLVEEAGFSEKTLPLACVILELLRQSQPDTVRGVMYAVVNFANWLPDTSHKNYTKVQRLLRLLRKKDILPYRWIVDNIRSTEKPSSWSGLIDFAEAARASYRLDFWRSLPDYVCLVVEKDTVAGRVAPITREYDVALHPMRGFNSDTFAFSIGDSWRQIEKPIHVYYIGDHDPSGLSIESDMKAKLAHHSGKEFGWTRLAVLPEQFKQYNITPLAPKKKDTRYPSFHKIYGDDCAEVEAIPADALRSMVENAILSHIPAGEWDRLKDIEHRERKSWEQFIGKFQREARAR